MREILFRAWDGKRYSIGNPEYFDDSVNFRFHHFDINCEKPILEQFTGLNDATKWEDLTDAERDEWIKSGHTKEDWKGRRIFEGDILQWVDEDNIYEGTKLIFIVKFDGEYEGFLGEGEYDNIEPWQFRGYKVIGNIHDNPELMVVEK